jgi:sterol O-acyltransferase
VHEFLLRHVYLESIHNHKVPKHNATFLTFFISSLLHELVLVLVGRRVRLYLFAFQMSQIPLIYLGRWVAIKKYPLIGNVIFWFGMSFVCLLFLFCNSHGR